MTADTDEHPLPYASAGMKAQAGNPAQAVDIDGDAGTALALGLVGPIAVVALGVFGCLVGSLAAGLVLEIADGIPLSVAVAVVVAVAGCFAGAVPFIGMRKARRVIRAGAGRPCPVRWKARVGFWLNAAQLAGAIAMIVAYLTHSMW